MRKITLKGFISNRFKMNAFSHARRGTEVNNTIADIRAYVIETLGVGGNYNSREPGHWMVDTFVANPLSVYDHGQTIGPGDASEAVGGILVEIEAKDGTVG